MSSWGADDQLHVTQLAIDGPAHSGDNSVTLVLVCGIAVLYLGSGKHAVCGACGSCQHAGRAKYL